MPQTEKNDIRIVRTCKALHLAMSKLLKSKNFKKISVLDLCEEAQIGRATFYAHFNDKYVLLKDWLMNLGLMNPFEGSDIKNAAEDINRVILSNTAAVKNIIFEADYETRDILLDFIVTLFGLKGDYKEPLKDCKRSVPHHNDSTVLRTFFAGGIIGCLLWQINNFFPTDSRLMNTELLHIIEQFKKWYDN